MISETIKRMIEALQIIQHFAETHPYQYDPDKVVFCLCSHAAIAREWADQEAFEGRPIRNLRPCVETLLPLRGHTTKSASVVFLSGWEDLPYSQLANRLMTMAAWERFPVKK